MRSKEIEFLTRLQQLTHQLEDILFFLKQEGLIDDVQIKSVKSSPDHPKDVHKMLSTLKISGKLLLLEYTWEVLPIERMKLLIITERNSKEFIYG